MITKKMSAKRRRFTGRVSDQVTEYFEALHAKLIAQGRKPGARPDYGDIISEAIVQTAAYKRWRGEQE